MPPPLPPGPPPDKSQCLKASGHPSQFPLPALFWQKPAPPHLPGIHSWFTVVRIEELTVSQDKRMRFQQHCDESVRLFGKPFKQVHLWLDSFYASIGARHRRHRHHLAGIEEVRRRWGDEAAEAARRHIISDLQQEGWREGRDRMPADEADYVGMGLF